MRVPQRVWWCGRARALPLRLPLRRDVAHELDARGAGVEEARKDAGEAGAALREVGFGDAAKARRGAAGFDLQPRRAAGAVLPCRTPKLARTRRGVGDHTKPRAWRPLR